MPLKVAPDAFLSVCPSRTILARIGEKWSLLVLAYLSEGPARFGGLKRKLQGVSQKMLTQTLRKLESDGLLSRKLYDEMPLRVEYRLTPLAKSLTPIILKLKQWAEKNIESIAPTQSSARPTRKSTKQSGSKV
jgi:DNA-binding HxlR family transcriptional regulator